MKKILFFLTIILISNAVEAQIKVQGYLNKKNVYFGDTVEYTILIEHPYDFSVEKFEIYNVLKDTAGVENFLVYSHKLKETKKLLSKKVKKRFLFQLIPIKIGTLYINELEIKCINKKNNEQKVLLVPSFEIKVSEIPKPKNKKFDGDIIDIKGQIWAKNHILILLTIIILLAISLYIYMQYRKSFIKGQQPSQQVANLDLQKITLDKLNELWQKNYPEQGKIKEFYLELTEIVRWYISKKYEINALELTTEELFLALKKKIDKSYNLKIRTFLENADLAKFAKYIPDRTQIIQDFEQSKELII